MLQLSELASGGVFGCALFLSGVYIPAVIEAQLLLNQFHMLQVFLGGSATSAVVLEIADRTSMVPKKHRPPSSRNVSGGALLGIGMALTGACPGTAMVQLGSGMINGALVCIGGVLGGLLFARMRPSMDKPISTAPDTADSTSCDDQPVIASAKTLDVPTALSIQPLTMLLLWVPMCIAIIGLAHIIDRPLSQYTPVGMVPPAVGGLLIGIAQAATITLTRHHIGASAAYEDLARWLDCTIFTRQRNNTGVRPTFWTPSTSFTAGVVLSAAALRYLIISDQFAPPSSIPMTPAFLARTIAGGASMVFGARLAGGCTSGHGISGLSKFSLSSLTTTAAIFAGGMLAARVLPS